MGLTMMIGFGLVSLSTFMLLYMWGKPKELSDSIRRRVLKLVPNAKIYISRYDFSYLAVEHNSGKLIIGLESSKSAFGHARGAYSKVYRFDDIITAEIIMNNSAVLHTDAGSQAIGMALGGLMGGGIGAMIGSLSGTKTVNSKVNSLILKVTVRDPDQPIHRITFFKSSDGSSPNGIKLRQPQVKIEEFYAHLVGAIHHVNNTSTVSGGDSVYVQDREKIIEDVEIMFRLKEKGIISEEEFQIKKKVLLQL